MRTTKRSDLKSRRRYGTACASALIAFATGCGADNGEDLKAELLSVQRGFHASLLAPDRSSMPQVRLSGIPFRGRRTEYLQSRGHTGFHERRQR